MTESSLAKNYSIIAVILALACIVAGYYVLTSFWPAYTFAGAQLTNAQADNTRFKQAEMATKDFLDEFRSQGQNIETLKLALPAKESDMANFITSLSQVATVSGMELKSMHVSDSSSVDSGAEHSIQPEDISLTVSGTYLAFRDFISRLEAHLRIVDVYQVSFTASADSGPETSLLDYSVELRTYYQK